MTTIRVVSRGDVFGRRCTGRSSIVLALKNLAVAIACGALASAVSTVSTRVASAEPNDQTGSGAVDVTAPVSAPLIADVASAAPGVAHTPDGRTLTVSGTNETELPVAPLTAALSTRDWLVGGTFIGAGMDTVQNGSIEVGYQIGCGITLDRITAPGITMAGGLNGAGLTSTGPLPPASVTFAVSGQIAVQARPGIAMTIPIDRKFFDGTDTRITLRNTHIEIDNCVGASSIRSYAVLTSSGTDADDTVAYYGTTRTY